MQKQFNDWILDFDLKENNAFCTKCNTLYTRNLPLLIKRNSSYCLSCNLAERNKQRGKDSTGKVFGFWRVDKELPNEKVLVTCLKCNEQYEKSKYHITHNGSQMCRKCSANERKSKNIKNSLSLVYNSWKVSKIYGNRCDATCMQCNTDYTGLYYSQIKNGKSRKCKSCYNKEKATIHNGDIFSHIEVIEYHTSKRVDCKCLICGKKFSRDTYSLTSGASTSCGCLPRRSKCKGHKLNGYTILSWAFRYEDIDFFNCTCNKCGNEMILSIEDMLNNVHTCNLLL